MTVPNPSSDALADALERESAWLHRLARALTRDREAASDAAQTTLLRAWQRGSDEPPKRAWLVRVLSNALSEDARRAGLRRAREEACAHADRTEHGPAPLERLELQRRVVDAVDALDEPYRTTLVLRFFDGLSPRAIAARDGVPRKTVYTRIERGLGRLRAGLDARCGNDRAVWMGALFALPPPGLGGLGLAIPDGAMAMSASAKVAGSAMVLAVAVGAIAWMRTNEPQAEEVAAPVADRAPAEPAPAELEGDDAAREARTEIDRSAAAGPAATPAPELPAVASAGEPVVLAGRVLDASGLPLAGVAVRVDHPAGARAVSDEGGRFALDWTVERLPAELVVDDERWAGLREAWVRRGSEAREHLIVAAPSARLRGLVVDDAGRELAGVAVSLDYPELLLADFPFVLDTTSPVSPRTETDAAGRFELAHAPVLPGCALVARKQGYESTTVELFAPWTDEPLIELARASGDQDEARATGIVLLPDRTPAEGATVRYGGASATTDRYGRFELDLDWDPVPDQPLAAGLEGYGTAIVERYGELQRQAAPYAPAAVTLVLHEEVGAITGRVVDARGDALAGWQVQPLRGTWLSQHQVPPILAEELAGAETRVETDANGRFELRGLLDRDYRLRVYDPESLVTVQAGPFAAGAEDVRIEVPDGLTHALVAGRVVSRKNEPVPNARVSIGLILHQRGGLIYWTSGTVVETDDDGRFELEGVPRTDVHLDVGGEDVIPARILVEEQDDLDELVIEVALRCHFRVEVVADDTSDLLIEVVDAAGEPLWISSFTATGSSSSTTKALTDGRMEPAAVSEDALDVVLYRRRDGEERQELARRPLPLAAGEISEVRIEL